MPDFKLPKYVLDLQDSSTCLRLASAQPGKEIRVLVRREQDCLAGPVGTIGTRSPDGQEFSIVVRSEDGKLQAQSFVYKDLVDSTCHLRPENASNIAP